MEMEYSTSDSNGCHFVRV